MIELGRDTPTPNPNRSRARKIVAGTAVVVVGGGAAFAYWTAGGSGTGSADSAASVADVTVVQTSTTTGLAPGSGAHALSGTFTNTNTGPVYVGTLTASIVSVTKADGVSEVCDTTDYTLTDASEVLNKEVLADDTSTWSGITISFVNKPGTDQDGCKGATVNLSYALS